MMPPCELAYIGPGAGFAFLGSFLTLALSLLAGLASLLLWPVRMAWLLARRQAGFGKAQVKRAIFLGLDGLDPNLTERYMAEGKLPNLSRLREQGTYRRLRTTFPPLSPVAWSTFATGVNPAKHNIFDFLNRDLRTYAPELSSAKVTAGKGWFGRPTVELRRKSEPFWKILGRHAIGSTILRVPITFPPEPFKGRMLSAMSTPDLRGTQGTFSWFTCGEAAGRVEGGNRYTLRAADGGWEGLARGPGDETVPFRVVPGWRLEVEEDRMSWPRGVHAVGSASFCTGAWDRPVPADGDRGRAILIYDGGGDRPGEPGVADQPPTVLCDLPGEAVGFVCDFGHGRRYMGVQRGRAR